MRALVILAILLMACPGGRQREDESQNSPSKTSTTTANPQAVPENSTAMNPVTTSQAAGAATIPIEVQLTEYGIQMPDTISAGVHTFHIANAGKMNHNFAIEGNGVSEKLHEDLSRGNTTNLSIKLAPGTYTIFCPVDGHRGKGMQRTITVQ